MPHGVQAWMAHRAEWSCEKTHLMMDFEAFMLLLVSVKKSKRYPCLGLASLWLCLVQGTKKKKKDASYYELAYIKCCRILNTFYTSIFQKSSKGTYKCLGRKFFAPRQWFGHHWTPLVLMYTLVDCY